MKVKDNKVRALLKRRVHVNGMTNLPLSSNQKRLWIINQQNNQNPAYNLLLTYHLNGQINVEFFRKSVEVLFDRQITMFSVFRHHKGEPHIDIIKRPVIIELIDFSSSDISIRKEAILSFAGEDSRTCFDIEKGPLYRLYLLKYDDNSYYFHATIHHLIFDAWSRRIFVQELSRIYSNIYHDIKNKSEPLLFYRHDFEKLNGNLISEKDEKVYIEFWKENLKDCPAKLNFPFDFPRKDSPSGLGYREPLAISKTTTSKLKQLAKEQNSTVFKTMLSVLGVLIQKYTGENDICIGIPVSNRREKFSNEDMFGLFVDTSVARLKIEKERSFREIINYTKNLADNAIKNSKLSFHKMVEVVNPERIPNLNPLFQIALSWLNKVIIPMDLNGIKGERINVPEGVAPFDITFYLWENGDIIEGEIEYSADLFKQETIRRLKDYFIILTNGLVENIDHPVESVSMISDDEKQMISSVNDTITHFSRDKNIIQLFEDQVVKNPEGVALKFDDGELTYSDLNLKAENLAGVLRTYNIGSGDFIGILLKRSPELIVCLLAIFKTGAAYVPLNLNDPGSRIKSIIDVADVKFVITNTSYDIELAGNHKRLNIEQLFIQSIDNGLSVKNTPIKSSDPAYIIFTSGTTGIPKGVLVSHRSVINLIEWVNRTFKISNNDKLLWITNLSFDLSVYDIFGILIAGGIIRIVSEEDRLDAKKQYDILLNEGITFWDSAPQSLLQLTPYFNRDDKSGLYDSLRLVFLSGDWIPLSLPDKIRSVFTSAVVVGLGGATEATIWSNYFIIDEINPEWKSIPYGKPIQNSRYYILDDNMDQCRIQQPGNLYIGGECLALEYYNDPVLTNSKFIPDPFKAGSKIYLTGDKAQWMPDGNIEFLGREDEQIKIRGYRVEIGEIKDAVMENKEIKEAIILPDKSDKFNIKLLLFFNTYNNKKPDVKNIRKELRKRLPDYMIPAFIFKYENFPVTSNGKIDTKYLLSDYFNVLTENELNARVANQGTNLNIESPVQVTETEKTIHYIWSDALKIKDISVKDNFFNLGGNSLLAILVMSKIESQFNTKLGLKAFFDCPRIEALAERIDASMYHRSEKRIIISPNVNKRIINGEF